MGGMFWNCHGLTSLDLSNFDTSNVTVMDQMFGDCISLTSLDVSNFDTSKVTDMRYMFENCSKLTEITVSNKWLISSSTNIKDMFKNCGTNHVTVA